LLDALDIVAKTLTQYQHVSPKFEPDVSGVQFKAPLLQLLAPSNTLPTVYSVIAFELCLSLFCLFADSNFVLGNAQVPSVYPVVYCSDGFCELTGFARAQIMQKGCACKFLYGPDTADEHKMKVEKALEGKSELKLEVILYKKSGKLH
jgi:hypothetical protein